MAPDMSALKHFFSVPTALELGGQKICSNDRQTITIWRLWRLNEDISALCNTKCTNKPDKPDVVSRNTGLTRPDNRATLCRHNEVQVCRANTAVILSTRYERTLKLIIVSECC